MICEAFACVGHIIRAVLAYDVESVAERGAVTFVMTILLPLDENDVECLIVTYVAIFGIIHVIMITFARAKCQYRYFMLCVRAMRVKRGRTRRERQLLIN